jgi:cell division septation protein DedD
MPPLHPVNPSDKFCAQKSGLVLASEGAPLVYATMEAHDLKLHIETKSGPVDVPLKADASQGGLVLTKPMPELPPGDLTGVVKAKWGFDDWEGPRFHLVSAEAGKWTFAPSDESALVVGRDDVLHIQGENTLCVERVEAKSNGANSADLQWKSPKSNILELSVPLKDAAPGPVTIGIHQYGISQPDKLTLVAYAEAASLEGLKLSAGDAEATLTGNRLDEVAKATLNGIVWTPVDLKRVQDQDKLKMKADGETGGLEPGKRYTAKVELRDGRNLKTPVAVAPPRPQVTLLSKGTQDQEADDASPVHLGSPNDLPVERRLVFFLKSQTPATFPRDETIEVAASDNSFHTTLSLSDGTLMLEDANTALGVVEPLAKFGSSAFGPVQARAISADGVPGDWLSLGTLVRMPGFKELHCPHSVSRPCTLMGTNLFLAESVASTADFDNAVDVPANFTGTQLTVPHPVNGILYLKLRDDPSTVQTLALSVTPMPAGSAAPTAVKPATTTPATEQQSAQTPAPPPSKTEPSPEATKLPQ